MNTVSVEQSLAQEVLRLAAMIAPTFTHNVKAPPSIHPKPGKGLTLRMIRLRLLALDCGLTNRELDVCSRAVFGMTAEGTALDLNVKMTSVHTYRKRAYARMGISSHYELFRLLVA